VSAARGEKPAWGWRLLAYAMLVTAGLMNLPAVVLDDVFGLIFYVFPTWIALAGLFGYAYGWRARPLWLWRVFAPLFSLYTMARLGAELGPFLTAIGDGAGPARARVFAFGLTVPLCFLTCIALLRQAELLRGHRRAESRNLERIFT
jgi:hypothetical protein